MEVSKIFKSLASNKASGYDGLSPRILKVCSSNLLYPLCKIINISIANSIFPSSWKIADVIPIHKGGPRDDSNNYRPVSILPVLSKIIERHAAMSLLTFLQENNLIYRAQSGFRPNHSTETALIKTTDNLPFNMDKDNVSSLVFLDFKMASDMVNHKVLLDKIGLYGGTAETVNWFKSYLSDRRQCVNVNGLKSSLMPVKPGVPQGSIVGPILFVLLINDLPLHVTNSDVDIYADDSTLTFSSRWYANISLWRRKSMKIWIRL